MEIVEIDSKLSDEQQVLSIIKEKSSTSDDVGTVRKIVLHSNCLSKLSIECLLPCANSLVYLDLSSNSLASMTSLGGLVNLEYLNLSNNKISEIDGLRGLVSLLWLDLSFNRLDSLSGLSQIHGSHFHLEYLNVKCNRIGEFREFYQLAGICHLKFLVFSDVESPDANDDTLLMDNPCCSQKSQIRSYLFKALRSIKAIDGSDESGNPMNLEWEFEDLGKETSHKHDAPSIVLESGIINTEIISRQISEKISQNLDDKFAEINETKVENENSNLRQIHSDFAVQKQELMQLNTELHSKDFDIQRLAENNEKLTKDNQRLNESVLESKQQHQQLLKIIEDKDERIRILAAENERHIFSLKQQIDHETMITVQLKHGIDVAHSNAESIADKYDELDRCYSETKQNLDSTLNAVRMEKIKTERLSFKLEKSQELLKQKEILIKEIEDGNIQKIGQITSQKDTINKLQSEIADLSLKTQKEKELFRINFDALQLKHEQMGAENSNLRSQLAQLTKSFEATLRDMKQSHEKEILNTVEKVAHEMQEKYSVSEKSMRKDFHAYKSAYETLECEFKLKISKETEKSKKLQSKIILLQQTAMHLQEECDRVNSVNEKIQSHQHESNSLIADQKRELETLRRTISKQSQTLATLKEKVKTFKTGRLGNDDSAFVRIRAYQEKLEAKDEELFKVSRRLRELEEDATRLSTAESVSKQLTNKLEHVEKAFNKVSEERDILQQAILMKNKMLEEHIETHRTLKHDLMKRVYFECDYVLLNRGCVFN